MENVELWNK